MFCKNCGNELKDGTLFCSECGTELTTVSEIIDNKSDSPKTMTTNDKTLTNQPSTNHQKENEKLNGLDIAKGSVFLIIRIAITIIIIVFIVSFINSFKFSVEKVQKGSPTFYTEFNTDEDKELGDLYLETFNDVEIGEVLESYFDNAKWEYKEDVHDGIGGKWDIVRFTGTYVDYNGITQSVTIDFRKYRLKEYLFHKAKRYQFCVVQIVDTGYTTAFGTTFPLSDEESYYYLKNCLESSGY